MEIVEAAIFNVVGNYGLRIMDSIFLDKGGSKQKLDDIAKLFRKWSIIIEIISTICQLIKHYWSW